MEFIMKSKILFIAVISALLIAACTSPPPAAEAVSVPEVEEVMEEEEQMEEAVPAESEVEEESESSDVAMEEVSFSQDVWPILEKYALAAHGGKGGVFLESYSDILANVEPGNPEGSLLYKALIGDGMKAMPPGNPLPEELVQTIYDWIKQGALEN
jgi:hypothetical protein